MTIKRTLAVLLALLSVWMAAPAPVLLAETIQTEWVPLAQGYNPSSASYIYCSATPANNPWRKVGVKITSSGTTISAVTTGQAPFFTMNSMTGTNFIVRYNVSGVVKYGKITAVASADSATVNVAPVLPTTGVSFEWALVNQCGTAATDGWFSVAGYNRVDINFQIDTLGSTSIDRRVECRSEGPLATATNPFADANYTAVGVNRMVIQEPYAECRVGVKVNTDGTDALTYDVILSVNR